MRYLFMILILIISFLSLSTLLLHPLNKKDQQISLPLKKVSDIPLPGGANRLDYQSINYINNRLYISHLGSDAVIVFDLKQNKVIKNIALQSAPYGILAVPELHSVYVGVGGNNSVAVIDENTLEVSKYIEAGETPDGLAYDPITKKVFISDENGGTVTVIDAQTNTKIQDIAIGGGVGNVQFDQISKKIFSVSGDENTLVEIDPAQNQVVKKYKVTNCSLPHGFYLDSQTHQAFISCQGNGTLILFDLDSKKIIGRDSVGDYPDVLAFDPELHRLYVASESGRVAIFSVQKGKIKKLGEDFVADKAHTVSVDRTTHLVYLPLENIDGKPVLRIMKPI